MKFKLVEMCGNCSQWLPESPWNLETWVLSLSQASKFESMT